MNGYELSKMFFDFSFENPEKVRPAHVAVYFFAIEHCNRLGWKEKFGFPTTMAMEAIGIKSYTTYKQIFDDLVKWDFFTIVERSRNQFSSNIIALSKFNKATAKATSKARDNALVNHSVKQPCITSESTSQSTVSINKPLTTNHKPQTTNSVKEHTPRFISPTIEEIKTYCLQNNKNVDAERFFNFYESKGWMVGKSKMKNWHAALANWDKESTPAETEQERKARVLSGI